MVHCSFVSISTLLSLFQTCMPHMYMSVYKSGMLLLLFPVSCSRNTTPPSFIMATMGGEI